MEMLEGYDLNKEEGYEIYEDTTDASAESDWKTVISETLTHNFQDLPDEIILKVLSFSEPKDLISSGQVSKRIRKISRDNSLWQRVSLAWKIVKTEFLEMILDKECKSLNLSGTTILGSLCLEQKSQLRILHLPEMVETKEVLNVILASCYLLQVLEMPDSTITPEIATSICQNGKTLQKLNLDQSFGDESAIMQIIKCCQELKEITLADMMDLSYDCLEFLAKNICPNVEILNISDIGFDDYHFYLLLSRCNKIKELCLRRIKLNNISLTNIQENLSLTLEKLSLDYSDQLRLTGFLELKSMPRLKFVFFEYVLEYEEDGENDDRTIEILRKQLPHLTINVEMVVNDENAYYSPFDYDFFG